MRSSLTRTFTRLSSTLTGRAAVYSKYGQPSTELKVVSFELPQQPSADQVFLKLIAAPINPADINQIEGVYPSRPEMDTILGSKEPIAIGGNEGLFEIVAKGSNVQNFTVGDWAIPIEPNFGTWRSHAAVNSRLLTPIPRGIVSPLVAATVSVNPATAYYLLTKFAKLEPGDWVIQNGGTSAVGRIVVQLAKLWKFKTISVIRDREDFDAVAKELTDLGGNMVISEQQAGDKAFKPTIKQQVGNGSIKLALNCVGGASCTNITRHLGQNGHLVTYGGMSKKPVTLPTSLFIFNDLTAHGYWLSAQTKRDPAAKVQIVSQLLEMFSKKQLKDVPTAIHEISASSTAEEFHRAFLNAIETKGTKQVVMFN